MTNNSIWLNIIKIKFIRRYKNVLNQFVIVGRLVNSPKLRKGEKGNVTEITLAVPRSYKNKDGEYETDFIDFIVYNGIAENTKEYCKKGDIVGVKGRIQTTIYEQENEKIKMTELIAEKITFLSSASKEKETE